jgi:hypothetical protein
MHSMAGDTFRAKVQVSRKEGIASLDFLRRPAPGEATCAAALVDAFPLQVVQLGPVVLKVLQELLPLFLTRH